jgi:dolichol-phosphate mannosyltransferase
MISIVIPIHNEASILPELLQRITTASEGWGEEHEIVLVDDGSHDDSLAIALAAAQSDPRHVIVKLSRNFGHQAAITAGLQNARGEAVIIMDGDLQDPPEELIRFIVKWREGFDVVYGVRTQRKEGPAKRLAYTIFYRLLRIISEIDIPLDSGDFCLMSRRVVDVLEGRFPEQIRFVRGLRAFVGFRQTGIPYVRQARHAGTPSYSISALMRLAIDGLLGFSMLPLRLASFLGFFIAIPSFLVGLYFILHRLFGFRVLGHLATDTPGLTTLAVGVFFMGGLTLIILGIIGEYLGRIYVEVKRRPSFVVERVYRASS